MQSAHTHASRALLDHKVLGTRTSINITGHPQHCLPTTSSLLFQSSKLAAELGELHGVRIHGLGSNRLLRSRGCDNC